MKQKKSCVKWKTRIFSAMLAFAMAVALLPVKPGSAYAAGEALADTPQTYANARPSAPVPTSNNTDWETGGTIKLMWTYSTSESVTKCEISRKSGSGSFTTIATVPVDSSNNVGSYTDTDLPSGTYTYRYRAYNSYGWSDYSKDWPVTISRGRPVAPVNTGSPSNGTPVVQWYLPGWEACNSYGITSYEISRAIGNASFSTLVTVNATSETMMEYKDSSVTSNGEYRYRIRAKSSYGWSDYSGVTYQIIGSVSVPSPPSLAVTPGPGECRVSWSASASSGNTATIQSFELSRKTGNGSYAIIASSIPHENGYASYIDKNVTAGTAYTYRVRAYSVVGYSGYSNESTVTPYGVPGTPSAPSVTPGNGQVVISWTAPAANGASITKYEVFQNGVSIGTTAGTTMTKTGLNNR